VVIKEVICCERRDLINFELFGPPRTAMNSWISCKLSVRAKIYLNSYPKQSAEEKNRGLRQRVGLVGENDRSCMRNPHPKTNNIWVAG
jgi:hypothetical protein